MPYKYIDIEFRLKSLGFKIDRQAGSHVIFDNGIIIIPVPKHGNSDISIGVERSIIRSLGISKNDFKRLK